MAWFKWWGAPTRIADSVALRRLDQLFPETLAFANAEPLTVRVRGAMILEDEDWLWRGDNDIMIVTTFQFGSGPPVQRLHFMEKEVPQGWQGNFFRDVVLSVQDFKDQSLTLRLQVYDMDGVEEGLVNTVAGVAKKMTVAFPQLASYAGAISFWAAALLKLVDNLDDHDQILDERQKLEVAEPGTAHPLLQPGYFICFKKPVEEGLFLSRDLRVLQNDQRTPFEKWSYAVLGVAREFRAHRDWEIDQKVAKLIAELKRKGQSGRAPLEFLRETLDAYTKFKKLERVRELQEKDTLTEAEQKLLDELTGDEDLRPFLPTTRDT